MNKATTDGPVRDCTCPVANHVHGTRTAYVVDKCRCRPCRDAAAAAERHRTRQIAYGRWEPYVDAQPAREHVKLLSEQGMGWKRVAEKAGIQSSTVRKLMYGDPRRKTPLAPSKQVRRETADKILAVTLDLANAAIVDATGTRRRLQALVAIGWSQTRLADQLGWNVGNFNSLILGRDCPRVQHDTQVRVRALYDRLWNVPPVAANGHQKGGITYAKRVAAKRGWVPPMAWDDETIDDPAARPHSGNRVRPGAVDELTVDLFLDGHRLTLGKPERVEVVRRLAARGHSDPQIAARVGVTARTVLRDRLDHGIPSSWEAAS